MKPRAAMTKTLLTLAVLLATQCAIAQPPAAGAPPAPPAGPVPRTADGKPDLSGYWNAQVPQALTNIDQYPGGAPPYTPEARAEVDSIKETRMAEEPELHCFMSGITHQVYAQFGFQLIPGADSISWINEFMGATRHIDTSGREHIHPNIKLFNGDSVAHWEGDTLVIDTTNQNGRTWLDVNGSFTTENLHVVERLRMTDANTIEWEATLTDPTIYTKPWTLAGKFNRNAEEGYEQMEFACIEGNRDLQHYLEGDGGTALPAF